MRFIQQKNPNDCGLCVAAMLANCSLARACELDQNPNSPHNLTERELIAVLQDITERQWSPLNIERYYPLSEHVPPRRNSALLLSSERGWPGERWVAWDARRKQMMDPQLASNYPWSRYPRQDWFLTRVIQMVGRAATLR
jgi:hypothetical protein